MLMLLIQRPLFENDGPLLTATLNEMPQAHPKVTSLLCEGWWQCKLEFSPRQSSHKQRNKRSESGNRPLILREVTCPLPGSRWVDVRMEGRGEEPTEDGAQRCTRQTGGMTASAKQTEAASPRSDS